ncbi:adenine deaminase [Salisediminibacterium halotolerans]|uniref:Adenine deaminase n=1 Tax=Salisediminibacterium halotolerans TaxID=517425 RepID=A0A1H9UJ95_9BACI|nr:adenine deaminase [Salisediminibacterium haloalkalitolerans]SES09217.1 adenine deaminase [Salisediminibacterium haloalkalitolerans]
MTNRKKEMIQAASGEKPADLVLKNGKVINVMNLQMEQADVAIVDGKIAGVGRYFGREEIDVTGKYIAPGFIDGHVHIESSMMTPHHFANELVKHGVTAAVTDPHEIANVSGADGIRFMLEDSANAPIDIFAMLPSCVPATPFEHAGARLTADDLRPFYDHPRVFGLAEVMDYPSVLKQEDDMLEKLVDAEKQRGRIDGHGAGFDETALNVYRAAGILTDHECTTAEEAAERIRKGFYVMMREGSAAKDLLQLLPAVTTANARRFLYCTDDKHIDEIEADGSIDAHIRMSIRHGMDPLQAIQLATLNAAECFKLHSRGAVAPGYEADLVVLDDLENVTVRHVLKDGHPVVKDQFLLKPAEPASVMPESVQNTVNITEIGAEQLRVKNENAAEALTIAFTPHSLLTEKTSLKLPVQSGAFTADVTQDTWKMAVIERHHGTGHIGTGFIQGLGLKEGAIAGTVAHDSHNLVVAGSNDTDMLRAIETIREMQGGLAAVKDGKVLASVQLEVAGLMTNRGQQQVTEDLHRLDEALEKLGAAGDFHPLSALSFMCLPVIPSLKLTDLGYFDAAKGKHVTITGAETE